MLIMRCSSNRKYGVVVMDPRIINETSLVVPRLAS